MDRIRSRHLIVSLLCVLILLAVAQAGAQGSDFSLVPYSVEKEEKLPRLEYSLEPGQIETGAVLVGNTGEQEAFLRLFAADARTGSKGGVGFPESSEPVSAVGGWISLSASEFTLQPQESRVVPFTIAVPPDARGGEHLAGILLELADPDISTPDDSPEGTVNVVVLFRKALNVRVMVPGDIETGLEITSVEQGWDAIQVVFDVALHNTGNIRVDPDDGQLEVIDASAKVLGSFPIQVSSILAEDTLVYRVFCLDPLPPGEYLVRVSVPYGEGQLATWESKVVITEQAVKEAVEEAQELGLDVGDIAIADEEGVEYWQNLTLGLGLAVALIAGVSCLLVALFLWLRRPRA